MTAGGDELHALDTPRRCDLEVIDGRAAEVGGIPVRRMLPLRARRTVGAWCFADRMGPTAAGGRALNVGPHPHIGLQTVTWLLGGSLLHRDSLGSEQVIRPHQLNLMTAGNGVSHSEEALSDSSDHLFGIQLWVAQPERTRHGEAAFEHHGELPQVDLGAAVATVLVGDFAGTSSPARRDTDHAGVEVTLRSGSVELPLEAAFEYAVVPLDGTVMVDGCHLSGSGIGYLGTGRDELSLSATTSARVMLLGGRPLEEELVMWWNYVARDRAEITAAHESWCSEDGRFGHVASPLDRITVPGPSWAPSNPKGPQ